MNALLAFSRSVDRLNEVIGKTMTWLILIVVVISAGNAVVRYAFDWSSNGLLEIQWYLFSAIFLLSAGYVLNKNEHIRIDVIAGRLSARSQNWIDVFGILVFLLPMAIMTAYLSWPVFTLAWNSGEVSANPGGLIRWPVRLLMPVGFFLLLLQGLSELVKRIAFLTGRGPNPLDKVKGQDRRGGAGRRDQEAPRRRGSNRCRRRVQAYGDRQRRQGRSEMTAFLIANMAPIIFASLVVFLLLGFPVAFSLAANGIIFGWIGIELGLFHPAFFQALPERIFGGIMSNDTLLAIPFFTFMGLILERSGMAEDLLDTIGQLFGPVRGGLAYAVVLVGAMLAATTGVVAASVISMGLISLPIMLRYGYDRRLASGVIAASGTLAQIIPPSLVLIIMADQLGKSVGDMYKGAFVPGFVLAGIYIVVRAWAARSSSRSGRRRCRRRRGCSASRAARWAAPRC